MIILFKLVADYIDLKTVFYLARVENGVLPNVIDFEHFIDIFRALLSNHEPILSPPDESEEAKVFDFCRLLISIIVAELCIPISDEFL